MLEEQTADQAADAIKTKDFGQSDAYSDLAGWTTLLGGPYGSSHTGIQVNPINSLQAGTVFACIRVLTGDISRLPLRLLRLGPDGIWLPEQQHPLARLLRRPNRRMTQSDLITHTVMSLLLVGNAYIAIFRDEAGRPVELVPLIPSTVSIREDGEGALFYYSTSRLFPGERKTLNFAEEDVIHVRAISLDGGIRGASPTQLASEVLGLALATQQFSAAMFKNSAMFQGLLSTDQRLSKEQVEQIQLAWNSRHSGVHAAYRTPLLQGGMKFSTVQQNAQESQLLETRRQLVEEVARVYGVPLYKLSSLDAKQGYNSLDAQQTDYVSSTLVPLCNPIEQAMEQRLLFEREFDKFRFGFDFRAIEKGDSKAQSERHHQLLSDGVLSVNEIRRELNLPSIGAQGDIFTKPTNMGVLGDQTGLPVYQIDAPVKESITEDTTNADQAPAPTDAGRD